jgi:hypothetical protein
VRKIICEVGKTVRGIVTKKREKSLAKKQKLYAEKYAIDK